MGEVDVEWLRSRERWHQLDLRIVQLRADQRQQIRELLQWLAPYGQPV